MAARQAVLRPPSANSRFTNKNKNKNLETHDLAVLVGLEGLSEKAKSKGYTSADLTVSYVGQSMQKKAPLLVHIRYQIVPFLNTRIHAVAMQLQVTSRWVRRSGLSELSALCHA